MSEEKDTIDLSKEELERTKLQEEIANLRKPFYKNHTFWPPFFAFLITAIVYFSLWKSGLFEVQALKIEYKTQMLQDKKDSLNHSINILTAQIIPLNRKIQELSEDQKKLNTENNKLKSESSLLKNEKAKLISEKSALSYSVKKLRNANDSIEKERLNKLNLINEVRTIVAEVRKLKKDLGENIQKYHIFIAQDTGLSKDIIRKRIDSFVEWEYDKLENKYLHLYEGKIFELRKKIYEVFQKENTKFSMVNYENYSSIQIVRYHIDSLINELEQMAKILNLQISSKSNLKF